MDGDISVCQQINPTTCAEWAQERGDFGTFGTCPSGNLINPSGDIQVLIPNKDVSEWSTSEIELLDAANVVLLIEGTVLPLVLMLLSHIKAAFSSLTPSLIPRQAAQD